MTREQQESARTRSVAVFDFDGTLSRRDTLIPFVARVAGPLRSVSGSVAAGWSGLRGGFDWRNRDELKEHMVERLLTGHEERDLVRRGGAYATRLLDGGLRPEMVEQLRRHVAAGHETLFVSASLVYYLEPLARHFDMTAVIGVEPEAVDGVLTGRLLHPNVRASEKESRLRGWLGAPGGGPIEGLEMWAYGNSSGDHELLAMADHAFWLGRPDRCPPGARQFLPGASF
jgi:phosphatidylglycerophosphatase C